VTVHRERVVTLAERYKLPAIYFERFFVTGDPELGQPERENQACWSSADDQDVATRHVFLHAEVGVPELTDYSVVVKNRAPPPKVWRWEIYRVGNDNPIKQSSIYFDTTAAARRAGKDALKELLNKLFN
jgi:hypothetical protein